MTESYPTLPLRPSTSPEFTVDMDTAQQYLYKNMWEYNTKIFGDIETMNLALVDRFLSLISLIFKSNYEDDCMRNPKKSFTDCVQYFINHFGATIENKREANKEMMKAE